MFGRLIKLEGVRRDTGLGTGERPERHLGAVPAVPRARIGLDVPIETKLHAPNVRAEWVERPRLTEYLTRAVARLVLVDAPAASARQRSWRSGVPARPSAGRSPGSHSIAPTMIPAGCGGTSPGPCSERARSSTAKRSSTSFGCRPRTSPEWCCRFLPTSWPLFQLPLCWCWTTTTSSRSAAVTTRLRSCCCICRRRRRSCSSPGLTRRCRWRACGPPGRWSRSGRASCASARARQPRSCIRCPARGSARPTWPIWWSGPRAGRPVCTWRRSLSAATLRHTSSSASSPAITGSSLIFLPMRCSAASQVTSSSFSRERPFSPGSAPHCATPSPARQMPWNHRDPRAGEPVPGAAGRQPAVVSLSPLVRPAAAQPARPYRAGDRARPAPARERVASAVGFDRGGGKPLAGGRRHQYRGRPHHPLLARLCRPRPDGDGPQVDAPARRRPDRGHPVAAHCAAWAAALAGDRETVRRWLPVVESGHYDGPLPDGMQSLRSSAAMLRGVFGFDGLLVMRESAATAVDLETTRRRRTTRWPGPRSATASTCPVSRRLLPGRWRRRCRAGPAFRSSRCSPSLGRPWSRSIWAGCPKRRNSRAKPVGWPRAAISARHRKAPEPTWRWARSMPRAGGSTRPAPSLSDPFSTVAGSG